MTSSNLYFLLCKNHPPENVSKEFNHFSPLKLSLFSPLINNITSVNFTHATCRPPRITDSSSAPSSTRCPSPTGGFWNLSQLRLPFYSHSLCPSLGLTTSLLSCWVSFQIIRLVYHVLFKTLHGSLLSPDAFLQCSHPGAHHGMFIPCTQNFIICAICITMTEFLVCKTVSLLNRKSLKDRDQHGAWQ